VTKAVFDATFLLLLVDPAAKHPLASDARQADEARDRIEYLIERLSTSRSTVIIPTPAYSELLVRGRSNVPDAIAALRASAACEVSPFDEVCGRRMRPDAARSLAQLEGSPKDALLAQGEV
jgi:hypothetical protein